MKLLFGLAAALILIALAGRAPTPTRQLLAVRVTYGPTTPEPAAPYPTLTPYPAGYPDPATETPYVPPYPAPMGAPVVRWRVWLPVSIQAR